MIDAEELGKLVYKKTQGNPFFVNQFLTVLHKSGHIRFVEDGGHRYYRLRFYETRIKPFVHTGIS